MSHPDDMGPQEDMMVGCFILFIFAMVFLISATIICGVAYLIHYFYTQGAFV